MPALASLTVLILILSLGLTMAAPEDPFKEFTDPSRGKRYLVGTCPEGYTSVEVGFTRVQFKTSQTNQCYIQSHNYSDIIEVGPKSGDFYFRGLCSGSSKYFLVRFNIRFYNSVWAKADEYSSYKIFVNNQETKIYRLIYHSSRYFLYEYDTEDGSITNGYNITGSISYNWGRFRMEFDDSDGAALFIADTGNLNQINGNIYKLDVASSELKTYNNLPVYNVDKIDFSYATNKIIVNHHNAPNFYLSLINLNSEPAVLEPVYAYSISSYAIPYYRYLRPDPSNPSTFFNIYDLYGSGATHLLLLSRISLQEPSESQTTISKYRYTASGIHAALIDFDFMDDSLLFLFYRDCSSCTTRFSNILFVMENVTEGTLPSIDQCITDSQQGNCRKVYITTNQLGSKNGFPWRIATSNQAIVLYSQNQAFIRTDLDSISDSQDFEPIGNLSAYFPGLTSASFSSVTHTGSTINSVTTSVSSAPTIVTTDEAELEVNYEESYINSFVQLVSKINIESTKGKKETFKVNLGCSIGGELNLKYSMVNISDQILQSYLTLNESTGSISVDTTDSDSILTNYTYTADMKIESSSIKGPVYIPMEIKVVEDTANKENDLAGIVGPSLAASFIGISAIIGSFSFITPNSGPSGLWMIINQQQLLVLLMLIDSHIHYDIKFFITRTKYVTFSFKELHLRSLDFTTISNQLDKINKDQTCEGLKDLGYEHMSAAQSNIEIPIAFILILIVQVICIITCILIRKVNWRNTERPGTHLDTEKNNNDFSGQENFERELNANLNVNEEENNVIPLSFWRKLWNRIKKWADDYLPIRFFTNVYIRICLEIFFIIAATTLNELTDPGFNNAGQTISFVFSLLLLFLCLAFIVFLFWYFYKHYNTDLTHENNERPKIYFGELFLDLRPGIGRIDNAMIILRKFIYLCIIFCPGLSPPAIFSMLIILQIGYLVQTVLFRKMNSLLLHIASIVNESFLILFMILFAVWRKKHHWKDDEGFDKKLFIIYLILLNTCGVILLQLISLVDLIKSCKTKNKQKENESASTGNALQSEESQTSNHNPTSPAKRSLAQIGQSNLAEIELSQSKVIPSDNEPIDYQDIELDSCEERIPVVSPEKEKVQQNPESYED